jgi:hypothetical protein
MILYFTYTIVFSTGATPRSVSWTGAKANKALPFIPAFRAFTDKAAQLSESSKVS